MFEFSSSNSNLCLNPKKNLIYWESKRTRRILCTEDEFVALRLEQGCNLIMWIGENKCLKSNSKTNSKQIRLRVLKVFLPRG